MAILTHDKPTMGTEVHVECSSQLESTTLEERCGSMTTDDETEKRLRKKFDLRILPFGVLIFLLAYIDRVNMGNAKILGMEKDVDLTGNRFNLTLTGFYVAYIVLEM